MNMTIYPIQQKKRKEYDYLSLTLFTLYYLHFVFKFFFFSFTTIWRESRKVQCHYVPWKLIYSFSVNSVMSFSWITFYDEVLTLEKSLIIYKFKIKLWSLAAEVWKRLKKKKKTVKWNWIINPLPKVHFSIFGMSLINGIQSFYFYNNSIIENERFEP